MSGKNKEIYGQLNTFLSQARDVLLDWSRGAIQADSEEERGQADTIFALAKETDDLRRRIASIREGGVGYCASDPCEPQKKPAEQKGTSILKRARRRKKDYPKYLRRGDTLVKVGLSKDRKKEYKHVVPALEYRRVLELVRNIGKGSKEFTAENILKFFEGPSYHAYIVLSLLRQKKVVKLVRRGTYKLSGKSMDSVLETIWNSLLEESNE